MIVLYILIAVLSLCIMVTVHEFGHYISGKLLGFKINEFSVGFGPKIFQKKKKNGEVFSLRCIPLGGYCAFEGEDDGKNTTQQMTEEEIQAMAADPRAFNNRKPWQRIIVLISGAVMNFLFSLLIALLVFAFAGFYFPTVAEVLPDADGTQTASEYLLQKGDIVVEINGKFMFIDPDMSTALGRVNEGEVMTLSIIRDGERMTVEAVKREYSYEYEDEDGQLQTLGGVGLGITRGYAAVKLPFFETLWRGLCYCFYLGWYILGTFWQLITGQLALSAVGGPITTVTMMAEVARSGFRNFMDLFTLIGVNLAVFNLLPIPALDGSRVLFTTLEWVRGKPILKRSTEALVHGIGMLLLFGFVIIADIFQLFV